MSNELVVVKRESWKAAKPTHPYISIFPQRIIIHHYEFEQGRKNTKTSQYYNGPESIEYMQSTHIRKLGLNDIRYHFIIAPDGTVYEGRPLGTAGCHCKKYDNTSIAIMFFGNYNIEQVEQCQLRSFLLLLKQIKETYRHLDIKKCLKNHRDYELTLCPGHHLSNLINIIKQRDGIKYD